MELINKKILTKNQKILLFSSIILIKLVLMGLFSSDYQNKMFMPFTQTFVDSLLKLQWVNPYELLKAESNLFPYPPSMLFFESIGALFSKFAGDSIFFENLLYKIPLLFFDVLGLYYIFQVCPNKKKEVIIYYFLSPIIIYACLIHGQLDIIPTTFLFGAICYLTVPQKRSDVKFVLMLFLALSCKLHILAIMPVLLLYIARREGWKKAIVLVSIPVLMTLLLIGLFFGEGMLNNVLLNNEQKLLTNLYFSYGYVKLYIPIVVILLIYFKILTIPRINKDLLYSFSGLIFTLFLALVPPMPGWYVWIVPFLSIFFINMSIKKSWGKFVVVTLNVVYLIYFIMIHDTKYVDLYFLKTSLDVFKLNNELIVNSVFSILTAILAFATYLMYKFGITSNSLYKVNQSFTIGLSGDSGSGKTYLVKLLEKIFGKNNLLMIEGDGDHKWERGHDMWSHYTHLNPKANKIYRQANDIAELRAGKSVVRTIYNHSNGKLEQYGLFRPKRFIVLSGLHSMYLPQIRKNLDLKIFMDIDENLRRLWKLKRDIDQRGHKIDDVISQIEDRYEDAKKYILPQKKHSDIIIKFFDENLFDYADLTYEEKLSLEVSVSSSVNLEPLIDYVETLGISVRFDFEQETDKQKIIFSGKALEEKTIDISKCALDIIPHIDDIIIIKDSDETNFNNIILLLVLITIDYKMIRGEG